MKDYPKSQETMPLDERVRLAYETFRAGFKYNPPEDWDNASNLVRDVARVAYAQGLLDGGDRPMNWQPINTAPMDGTFVDLWIEAEGARFRVVDYRWNGTAWEHKHGGTVDHNYYNVGMRVTHWMPGPEAPA